MDNEHKNEIKKKMAACYVPFLGWIVDVGFLASEKDKKLRFHAVQSLILHGVILFVYLIAVPAMRMTVFLAPVSVYVQGVFGVAFVLVCLLMLKAIFEGKELRLSWISEWADKIS